MRGLLPQSGPRFLRRAILLCEFELQMACLREKVPTRMEITIQGNDNPALFTGLIEDRGVVRCGETAIAGALRIDSFSGKVENG